MDYISKLKKAQEPKAKKQKYKYKDIFEKVPVNKKDKVIKQK